MSRRMTFIRGLERSGINPLLLDGGDFLFTVNDYLANAFKRAQMVEKARLIVECYNRFGYRAAAVGECEIALGLPTLRKLEAEMRFPLICANLRDADDKLLFKPSVVLEHDGLKIAVVAAMSDKLSPVFLQRTVKGGKILPPVEAIRAEVERVRSQADIVFVMAHVDKPQVFEVAAIPGVDMILEPNSYSGNHVIWLNPGQHFEERDGRVVIRAEGQGSHVSRVDATLRGAGLPWKNKDNDDGTSNLFVGTDYSLGPQYGADAAIQKMLDTYRTNTKFVRVDEPVEFTPSDKFLTVSTCVACHQEQHAFWKGTGHAKAYETLEKTGDQFRLDCLPCHVVGYGETFIDPTKGEAYRDVQCESCHGTNPEHPAAPEQHQWPRVDVRNCWGCHNPAETKVLFDPMEAVKKVACPPLKRN